MSITKRQLDCGGCGKPVGLSRDRFLLLVKNGRLPVCPDCRPLSDLISERLGADEKALTARGAKFLCSVGQSGKRLVAGSGKRGSLGATLASSKIRRAYKTSCAGAAEVAE